MSYGHPTESELLVDPHAHTHYSDGLSTPRSMFRRARAQGLFSIVLTDHDTVAHWPQVVEASHKYEMPTALGVEVSTAQGHLLAYFPMTMKPRTVARSLKLDTGCLVYLPVMTVIKRVHDLGGVAVVPHPFGPFYPLGGDHFNEVDGVEEYNAWIFKDTKHFRNAFGAGEKHGIAALGGSDSHYPYTVGFGATAIPKDCRFDRPDWWLRCILGRTTRPVVRQTIAHRRINYLKFSVSIPLSMRYNAKFWRSKWKNYWRDNYQRLLTGGELLEKIRKEI
ncbi:MAG: PHP domain-containing protein [Verrucomicrobiae bacterium]|nr:PHP domain-containing protein [Verrucomicrobiae bacterium]